MAPKQRVGFPAAAPEAEGLSPEPLRRLRAATQLEVRKLGALAGAAHIILRNGKCVFASADGWANREQRVPFGPGTLCRLHGCTKPLVAAALLTLVDEGRVKLSDPVALHLPFADTLRHPNGKAVLPLKTRPTVRHLLTMTAGLQYDSCPDYKKAMAGVRSGKICSLPGMCDALAKAPLQAEPGTRYEYSFCTDMAGRLCEAVSGERLDAFVKRRVLTPLGMRDTHFEVPSSKRKRVALLYDCVEQAPPPTKRGRGASAPFKVVRWHHPDSAKGIMSAGGGILSYNDAGMYSTAKDYARFCQMLLNGGVAPGGKRLLSAKTSRMIWLDGLAPYAQKDGRVPGWNDSPTSPGQDKFWDRNMWTLLNTHLVTEAPPRKGSARSGHTMWMGGGGGTYWSIDRRRKLIALTFTQSFGGRSEEDGLGPRGNDAGPFALEAVRKGGAKPSGARPQKRGKGAAAKRGTRATKRK